MKFISKEFLLYRLFSALAEITVLIFNILFAGRASESGTYSILQHPKSLKFKGNEELHTNNLLNVHAASSGFSTQEENKKWSGLIIANPFNTPQIDVIIVADGVKRVKSIEMKDGVKSFPLEGDSVHESLNMLSTIAEENESQYIDIDLRRNFKDVLHEFFFFLLKRN